MLYYPLSTSTLPTLRASIHRNPIHLSHSTRLSHPPSEISPHSAGADSRIIETHISKLIKPAGSAIDVQLSAHLMTQQVVPTMSSHGDVTSDSFRTPRRGGHSTRCPRTAEETVR